MKDFMLLFKSPSELYQKGRQNVSISIPMILYMLLGCLSVIALYCGVESGPTVDVLKSATDTLPMMLPITLVSGIVGTIIGLVIIVQIVYYVMILTCKVMDDVEFEKRQVKKLIYLAEILPAIPISLLQIIFMFATKTEVPLMLSTICGFITSLLTSLMIAYTMKVSMGTKKAHIIYPSLVFVISAIIQILSFISANNTLTNLNI